MANPHPHKPSAPKVDELPTPVPTPAGVPRPDMIPIGQNDAARQASASQLETQTTAEEQERKASLMAAMNAAQDALDNGNAGADREAAVARTVKAAGKKGEKYVEVLLLKKYAPNQIANEDGELVEQGEVKQTLPAGTTIRLPQAEASRALQLGIAQVTSNSFED